MVRPPYRTRCRALVRQLLTEKHAGELGANQKTMIALRRPQRHDHGPHSHPDTVSPSVTNLVPTCLRH